MSIHDIHNELFPSMLFLYFLCWSTAKKTFFFTLSLSQWRLRLGSLESLFKRHCSDPKSLEVSLAELPLLTLPRHRTRWLNFVFRTFYSLLKQHIIKQCAVWLYPHSFLSLLSALEGNFARRTKNFLVEVSWRFESFLLVYTEIYIWKLNAREKVYQSVTQCLQYRRKSIEKHN